MRQKFNESISVQSFTATMDEAAPAQLVLTEAPAPGQIEPGADVNDITVDATQRQKLGDFFIKLV